MTDFAIKAIDAEKLGEDQQADMLCISYSTPDIVGHAFGPYSVEIQDMYMRLDLDLKRLIESLEEKVGKYNFTVFLTADHAVVPVPQQLMDKQLPVVPFHPPFQWLRHAIEESEYLVELLFLQVEGRQHLDHVSVQVRIAQQFP